MGVRSNRINKMRMAGLIVRNEEATGSIPVSSTMFPKTYGKSGKGNVRPHLAGRDWLDAVAGLFDYFS